MRIRINTKGEIREGIENFFNHVKECDYIKANNTLIELNASLNKYFLTRHIDMKKINEMINGLQFSLQRRTYKKDMKNKIIFEKMEPFLKEIENSDRTKSNDKYVKLKEIYEDLVDDVEKFAQNFNKSSAEAIRADFSDIRDLEDKFMVNINEYKKYQELVKQIGICQGSLIKLSVSGLNSSSNTRTKILRDFDFLFPKVEALISSKLYEEDKKSNTGSKDVIEISDDKINEVLYLHNDRNMNAEQISEHLNMDMEIVESIIFSGVNDEG